MSYKNITRRGLMLVISSPSGAGKTTLAKMLLKIDKHLHKSISYTTREPRPGEEDKKDYFFVDEKKFQEMVDNNEFLEHATVFGKSYGIPKHYVEDQLKKGEDLIFDIDWQGHRTLKELAKDDVVSVFILPPSKMELKARLIKRAQDAHETIDLRLKKANSELEHWHEYDYTIVNKDLNRSLRKLLSILRAERLRKNRRKGVIEFVNQLIAETL